MSAQIENGQYGKLTDKFHSATLTIPSVIAYGKLLDRKAWSQPLRAKIGFLLWLVPQFASLIWIGVEYSKFGIAKTGLDYQL